jgi:hypothetical protein
MRGTCSRESRRGRSAFARDPLWAESVGFSTHVECFPGKQPCIEPVRVADEASMTPSCLRRSVAGLAVLTSVHACSVRCPPVTPCAADDRCVLSSPELHDPASVARTGCAGPRTVPPRCAKSGTGSTVNGVVRTGVEAQAVRVVGRPRLDLRCAEASGPCWSSMLLADPEAPHAEIALLHVQADQVVPFACRGDVSAVCCELPADTRTLLVAGTFRAASTGTPGEPARAGVVVSSV